MHRSRLNESRLNNFNSGSGARLFTPQSDGLRDRRSLFFITDTHGRDELRKFAATGGSGHFETAASQSRIRVISRASYVAET